MFCVRHMTVYRKAIEADGKEKADSDAWVERELRDATKSVKSSCVCGED